MKFINPDMVRIFVTRRIPDSGLELLRGAFGKFEINALNRVLTKKELMRGVKGCDGVLSLLTDTIDAEVMDAAGPQCKIFSNYAVGFNNINIEEASRRRIMIANTPGVLTDATSELAIALLFAAARRIVESDAFTRKGKFKGWAPMLFLGQDVTGRTLGIVGAGRIGTNMALKMASGFEMKILYTDINRNMELERRTGAHKVELAELLKKSDFVSLHVNLNEKTRHMIGAQELETMKPGAVLINTARGAVVDEKALIGALREKKIFAAGLDVFENEPKLMKGLTDLPNAVIVPHIASATHYSRDKMAVMAAQNLIDALNGKMPEHLVNRDAFK